MGADWIALWCDKQGLSALPSAFADCGASDADWGYLLGSRLVSKRLPRPEKVAHRRGISRAAARAMIAALIEWEKSAPRKQAGLPSVGDDFGAWTVVSGRPLLYPRLRVPCVCVCGTRRHVSVESLRYGRSRSCGCSRYVPQKKMEAGYASA